MDFCSFSFVCTSYKCTFLNRSDNTWRQLRLHITSSQPSSALPATHFHCRMTNTDLPAHMVTCVSASPTRVYMRSSSRRFSAYFVLSARSRVCVHRRVVTYSGHFLLRFLHGTFFCNFLNVRRRLHSLTCVSLNLRVVTYSGYFLLRFSHGTFFCNFLNARRRLHSLTCVSLNPRVVTYSGHFDLRYYNIFLLTHLYSLQHSLLLMLALTFTYNREITPYIMFRDW